MMTFLVTIKLIQRAFSLCSNYRQSFLYFFDLDQNNTEENQRAACVS